MLVVIGNEIKKSFDSDYPNRVKSRFLFLERGCHRFASRFFRVASVLFYTTVNILVNFIVLHNVCSVHSLCARVCNSGANYPTYHVTSFELCDFCPSDNTSALRTPSFHVFIPLLTERFILPEFRRNRAPSEWESYQFHFWFRFCAFVARFLFSRFVFAGGDCNASIRRWTIDGNIRSDVCAQ